MRAEVGMIDGQPVTWTDADRLHHVEVTPSGALAIYVTDDTDQDRGRFRAAYALGVWVTVDVTE